MPQTPIIIENFQAGIADSPHTGFADMRNVVVDKQTGVVEINWRTVAVASAVVGDIIKWFAQDTTGEIQSGAAARFNTFYATTDSGRLLRSTDAGDTWTNFSGGYGRGEGLTVWKDFVIVAHSPGGTAALSAYGPLSQSPIWSTAFARLYYNNDPNNFLSFYNPILKGQDDILYVGDGRFIDSLQEVSGQNFNAGTAATYIWGTASLDSPENYKIKNIVELGQNLMAGTWKGSTPEQPQARVATIFPWDRTADSFFLPIEEEENGIQWQINIGNIVYYNAGVEGKIFATNGSFSKLFKQLPRHLTGLDSSRLIHSFPGATMKHKGKLYFGIASSQDSGNELEGGVGVYSIDLETGALVMENQLSTGTTGGTGSNAPRITAIYPINRNQYVIGYNDAAIGGGIVYGIDKVSNTERYTNYAARVDSQFYSVASKQNPRPFSTLEFELAKPLLTGQGIRFLYRTNLADSFTAVRTFDFATDGGITTANTDFKITTEGGLQIRTEMTTGSSSTTTVELKNILIK